MRHGFLIAILIAGVLGATGCSRDIPLQPAEEWRGSYQLDSGTSGGGAIDVLNPPQGTPRFVIFTASSAERGTAIFVYNPPLVAPPMETVSYDMAQRRYIRPIAGTREQLDAEGDERLRWGKFLMVIRGPRRDDTGRRGNDLRQTKSPDAGGGRSPVYFQAPWPREDARRYRMLMFVPDGFGLRILEYARDLTTIAADSLSGTWLLDDGHMNGTYMDPKNAFLGIPTKLQMTWNVGRTATRGSGVTAEIGKVDIVYDKPLVFATFDDSKETRFFNSRATYTLVNGVPTLLSPLKGSSPDNMSITQVNPSDVQFSKSGDILTVNLNQGGQSYTLTYKQVPKIPQELPGFGDGSIVVEPVPVQQF